jgi:hypothetical protein
MAEGGEATGESTTDLACADDADFHPVLLDKAENQPPAGPTQAIESRHRLT